MSANSIIRKFNTSEDVFYENQGTILYFKLALDKEEVKRKNVVFCKICVNKKSSLTGISQSVFSRIQNKYLNKNKPDILGQYEFEYNPIETDFSGDEVYGEYLFGIPLNIVRRILPNSDPHVFTVYFLNKNKNIIEFYSYTQEDFISIENYKKESNLLENIISKADFLENNIDFVVRDYSDNLSLGPVVQVSDLFEEFPGNEDYKDNITLKIDFKDKSYEYNNIFQSNFSIKLIEDYKHGIIFDLYEDLLLIDETSKTITLEYSYLENIVIVEKTIPKSLILSLYASYYKKHKAFFIRDTFFGNINIQIEQEGIFDTIILDPCDTKYLVDFDADLSKFKIKRGSIFIEKLFTLINLDQDSAIFSTNKLFSYSSIFGQEKNIYFIDKRSESPPYTFYYENIEIVNNDSIGDIGSIENDQNLNDSILGSQIFSNSLQNPRINGRKIIAGLNTSLVYENKNPLAHLGFNIENNDYIEREVLEDTIIKLNVNYFNSNNEKVSAVMFDRMSNLISEDLKTLNIDLSASVGFLSNTASMEVKSITLPKNTLSKIFSQESNIVEEKENIASFLNNVSPDKFHVITNLIDKSLFKKQSTIEKQKTYEAIFGIFDNIESVKRIVENEDSVVDTMTASSINTTSRSNISLNNINSKIKNISSFSNHQSIVDFKSIVSVKDKSIILSSNQKNNVIANVYLDKVLKNNLDIQDLAFNVKRLITYEFYENDWKSNVYNTSSKRYFNEKEMQLITNNLPFTILGNKLLIGNKESSLQISDDVYTSLYSCWGNNNELYINNVIERLCITIKQKSSGEIIDVLFFNNRVEQDLLSSKNYISNINLLGDILHKPSIILQYR